MSCHIVIQLKIYIGKFWMMNYKNNLITKNKVSEKSLKIKYLILKKRILKIKC